MPFANVKAAVDAIQTGCAGISGVNFGPSMPSEQMEDWPYVTTYPSGVDECTIVPSPKMTVWWDLIVEVHWLRQNLPADMAELLTTFPEAIIGKICYIIQSNNTAFKSIAGKFGGMEWGSIQTIGFQFTIKRLKIQTDVPTS